MHIYFHFFWPRRKRAHLESFNSSLLSRSISTLTRPAFPSRSFKRSLFTPIVFLRTSPVKTRQDGLLMSPLKRLKVHAIMLLCRQLMFPLPRRCASGAATLRTKKPRPIRSLNCMWARFSIPEEVFIRQPRQHQALYESGPSSALPVYCGQITNWFDPNSVGATALFECITWVKINPQARQETFFFTLSEKQRSV